MAGEWQEPLVRVGDELVPFKPVMPDPRLGLYALYACPACGGLVSAEHRESHAHWHWELTERGMG